MHECKPDPSASTIEKKSSTVYYYHTDHLGSSSIITNSSGSKVEEIYYYPYGGTRLNSGSVNVKHKFTGQEEDAETGLYYYGARYYDPLLGRFISADTIVPLPFHPQTLNRYAYAYNNPIVLQDLNGHEPDINGYYYQDFYSLFDYSFYDSFTYSYTDYSYYGSVNTITNSSSLLTNNSFGFLNSLSSIGSVSSNYVELRAGNNVIGAVPGYPEINNNLWRGDNDQVFISAVDNYNSKYGLSSGDLGYWTPERLKAQAMIESGGRKSAFLTDSLQVNNSEDWDLRKSDIAGIDKGEVMTPYTSSAAALEWMRYKGYIHDSKGNEVEYRGDYQALRGYNGNRKIYSYHLGVQHRDWYAIEILNLEFLMRYGR